MTHKFSGLCGRCDAPTGSFTAQFCTGCRLVKVRALNAGRKGIPLPKHGKFKAPPLELQLPPLLPGRNLSPRSWWAGVTREQLQAEAATELKRMANSDYGRARGGLSQDIY